MASKVDGTTITLTRGDTLRLKINITLNDQEYIPVSGDSIRFALKHPTLNAKKTDFKDLEPLILKTVSTESMILQLDPADTKNLDFGTYVYDMEITFSDGSVDTFITEAKFIITPQVY